MLPIKFSTTEMGITVLGKDEDAADSYAATRLIGFGADFSKQMVADSAKGWFLSDRGKRLEFCHLEGPRTLIAIN